MNKMKKVWLSVVSASFLSIPTVAVTAAATAVTPPGDTDPPLAYFSYMPVLVDFDASAPNGGIQVGITLESGMVQSTEHPRPPASSS
ncbi:MAG: hypothetical protein ACYTA5_03315 [Planctomycetota bacterium]|jgi:hypothetical protein